MSTRKVQVNAMGNELQTILERLKNSETYDKEVARDEISELIHHLMKKEGVKKVELAKRLGKSRAYITKILQGNANFTLDTIVQIARALGYKFAPTFVPKAEWQNAGGIHVTAKAARSTGAAKLDNKDYVPVPVRAEVCEDEESTERLTG